MTHHSHITVGKPDVSPDAPSHTEGIAQGNTRKERPGGLEKDGTARKTRSTGIEPGAHVPILPTMPKLTPG